MRHVYTSGSPSRYFSSSHVSRDLPTPALDRGCVTAHVPVVLGCSHACTFCVIPYRRGAEARRRPMTGRAGPILLSVVALFGVECASGDTFTSASFTLNLAPLHQPGTRNISGNFVSLAGFTAISIVSLNG